MSSLDRVWGFATRVSGRASGESSPGSSRRLRRIMTTLLGPGLAAMALALSPGVASAAPAHICSGTDGSPGVLTGTYPASTEVVVQGWCVVNDGQAKVEGNLILKSHSVLLAAFARNDVSGDGTSGLTVLGNVKVLNGATLLLGCEATHFACLDDPNQNEPKLNGPASVGGNVTEIDPLGVVVHLTTVGGSITEKGGGGGETCNPIGPFAKFGSPVYSDYEDMTIANNLSITHLTSCWLGVERVQIGGNATFKHDQLADPDAIEIGTNHIGENLSCFDNSMVWDSGDLSGDLFPRIPQPNTVEGTRSGQCVLASPLTKDGKPGPGPF
jgi:hypothetical protein